MIEILTASSNSNAETAMATINLLWILPLYLFVYFIITFLFTYRVRKISEKNWKAAAMFGFAVEFLFISTTVMATTLLNIQGVNEYVMVTLTGLMAAIGNGSGTYLVGITSDRKIKKENKLKEDIFNRLSDKEILEKVRLNSESFKENYIDIKNN